MAVLSLPLALAPPLTVLGALMVVMAARAHLLAGVVLAAVFLLTGFLEDFLYEVVHTYQGPIEGITKYLNEHGSKEDVVAITYGDMPLKFYTDMLSSGA